MLKPGIANLGLKILFSVLGFRASILREALILLKLCMTDWVQMYGRRVTDRKRCSSRPNSERLRDLVGTFSVSDKSTPCFSVGHNIQTP